MGRQTSPAVEGPAPVLLAGSHLEKKGDELSLQTGFWSLFQNSEFGREFVELMMTFFTLGLFSTWASQTQCMLSDPQYRHHPGAC